MKIKNNFKKSINLGLIALVSTQAITSGMAAGAIGSPPDTEGYFSDILDSSILNVSPGGLINSVDSSGNLQSTTYHGTSIYFRFGPSFEIPEPIFNFSAPKMSIGCGGLSIKGMFANIIGLDRFEVMLKNAGASFAWGIVVGLVYSLPGIGTAFRMLNEFASKLQQLLGNACESGMALGAAIGKSAGPSLTGAIEKVKSTAMSSGGDKVLDSMDNGYAFLSKNLGTYFDENMVLTLPTSSTPTAAEIGENWKYIYVASLISNSMQLNYINAIMAAMPSESVEKFMKQIYGGVGSVSEITNFSNAYFALTYNNESMTMAVPGTTTSQVIQTVPLEVLMKWLNSGGGTTGASLAHKADLAQSLFSVAFARKIAGDLGVSGTTSLSQYGKSIEAIVGKAHKASPAITEAEAKAISKTLMDKVQGGSSSFNIAAVDPEGQDLILADTFMDKVINYMVFGTNHPGGAQLVNMKVQAPTFMVTCLPADIIDSTSGAITNRKIFVFNSLLKKDSPQFFDPNVPAKGTKARSVALINSLIGAKSGQAGTATATSFDIQSLQDEEGIILVVPGILDKIRIIQNAPDISFGGIPARDALIDTLANYNAYHVTYAAVRGMLTGGDYSHNEIPAYLFTGNEFKRELKGISRNPEIDVAYQAHLSKLTLATKDLVNKLDERILKNSFGSDKSIMDSRSLDSLFREVELQIKSNAVKQTQSATQK